MFWTKTETNQTFLTHALRRMIIILLNSVDQRNLKSFTKPVARIAIWVFVTITFDLVCSLRLIIKISPPLGKYVRYLIWYWLIWYYMYLITPISNKLFHCCYYFVHVKSTDWLACGIIRSLWKDINININQNNNKTRS